MITMRRSFGSVPVTTGAQVLAALFMLLAVASIVTTYNPTTKRVRILRAIWGSLQLVAGLLVFEACRRQKAALMVPMLFCSGTTVVVTGVMFTLCLYGVFDLSSLIPNAIRHFLGIRDDDMAILITKLSNVTEIVEVADWRRNVFALTVMLTVLTFLSFVYSTWCFAVFHLCFKELIDEQSDNSENSLPYTDLSPLYYSKN